MATYSSLGPDEIGDLERQLGVALTDVRPMTGGMANSSFRARSDHGDLVITVLDDHDHASARRLVEVMGAAGRHGLHVQRLVVGTGGDPVLTVAGKPVIVKAFIAGHHLDPVPDDRLGEVGGLLATVHEVAPPPSVGLRGRRLPEGWRETMGSDVPADLLAVVDRAASLEPMLDPLPAGLLHGDLFADNLLVVRSGDLVVLDWENATVDAFVIDVATTAVALCRTDDDRLDRDRLDAMVAGYQARRPLTPAEGEALVPAIECANALLAWQRYVRHNVFRPDPAQARIHAELVRFGQSLAAGR